MKSVYVRTFKIFFKLNAKVRPKINHVRTHGNTGGGATTSNFESTEKMKIPLKTL